MAEIHSKIINNTMASVNKTIREAKWTVCPAYSHCYLENDNGQYDDILYCKNLHEMIDTSVRFLWHGPSLFPTDISEDYLTRLKGFFKDRKIDLWEYMPLNIYRPSILSLNPYSGRDPSVVNYLDGLMLVPHSNFESSKVLIMTVLDFIRDPHNYVPKTSLRNAISLCICDDPLFIENMNSVIRISPGSFLKDPYLPKFIGSGKEKELEWFNERKTILGWIGNFNFDLKSVLLPLFKLASSFISMNLSCFSAIKKEKGDEEVLFPLLIKATKNIRKFEALLVPSIESYPLLTKYSRYVLSLPNPDKKSKELREICANIEYDISTIKSSVFSGPEYRDNLVSYLESLRSLEEYLVPVYTLEDVKNMRIYLNDIFLCNEIIERPPVDSPVNPLQEGTDTTEEIVPDSEGIYTRGTGVVPGLIYIEDYISKLEEQNLIKAIDTQTWSVKLKRRTQQYGYEYDYASRDDNNRLKYLGPLPQWLKTLAEKLQSDGICPHTPDQVIINEYRPGQGINRHKDHETSFEDCIISISLSSDTVMNFRNGDELKKVLLKRRSLICLSGESRYEWLHEIESKNFDMIDGKKKNRQRRISITLRKSITPKRKTGFKRKY
eukprot:TRINITY_DN4637_c0_g1_i2.p1 TRINITY_DN4637_c0_g1~~TRINITY_DN4637_c0_g1_i2.p1  ORF type:complete len:607 (-),score=118.66 TRINITY_DN4637_c0_g1_i2:24-1844(-)